MPPPLFSADELTSRWLDWLRHNRGRSPATASKYAEILRRLAAWGLKARGRGLLAMQPNDLADFVGPEAHANGISPRARRPMVAAIKSFYRYAAAQQQCAVNTKALEYPRVGRRLPVGLSLHDAERLLMAPDVSTLEGLRNACMIALFIGCGLRVSGLASLNNGSLIWTHDQLSVLAREKGQNERLIPVPIEAATLLRAYLSHPELASIDRSTPDGDQVLFVALRYGTIPEHEFHGERRRLSARGIRRVFETLGERAGVDRSKLHPHASRHLYGTELAESSVDLLVRQALLGHEDPKSTEIYTRTAVRKLRDTIDRANPLGKMHNPLLQSLRDIAKATRTRSQT